MELSDITHGWHVESLKFGPCHLQVKVLRWKVTIECHSCQSELTTVHPMDWGDLAQASKIPFLIPGKDEVVWGID